MSLDNKVYKLYCLFDGSRFTATSHTHFVGQLRDTGRFVCHQGEHEYMEGFAHRLGIYCGVKKLGLTKRIDCSSTTTFVDSLIANKLLTINELVLH